MTTAVVVVVATGLVLAVAVHDLLQTRHTILRNFPIIGHLRFILESFGPELRQYIVTGDNEEAPFTRDQRRWVYTSSKGQDNRVGFGTDNQLELSPGYVVIKHVPFPFAPAPLPAAGAAPAPVEVPAAKVLGGARGRPGRFRPASVVNISAMSFGSLSAPAVEALNEGAAAAGCLHNTGEGGISPVHRRGGELVWQIGTGYFGCRDAGGRLDLDRLAATAAGAPVRAIEIKLSQGAKPGLGGFLPATKVTAAVARMRGVPVGEDCVSPPYHTAFSDVGGLLAVVERIAELTGLPVGIKSAVGDSGFWDELAARMASTGTGPDFITIDGGEGGTAAAPLVFSDHVALPFKLGFSRVYRAFAERGLTDEVVFVGSGKLGLPENALLAMALGCDLVSVAREAMLAMGCVQARRCHTGRCPAGIATQSAWLSRGLDVPTKAARVTNYVVELRRELLRLAHAVGVAHPALVTPDHLDIIGDTFSARSARTVFGYEPGWGLPGPADRAEISRLMAGSR